MAKKKEIAPLKIILTALVLFFLGKSMVLDLIRVDGHSMEPAVLPGQFILINKLAYGWQLPVNGKYLLKWQGPVVGDIVAVRHPLEDKIIIKRCLGSSGDKLILEKNFLIIHSRTIPAGGNNLQETLTFPEVPDDKILIIGDNYENSIDSRSFGFVSKSSVVGKVILL